MIFNKKSILNLETKYSYVFVFLVSSFLSLFRVIGKQWNVIGDLVWAEDGMYALCNLKYGPIVCNLDSYNGIFHLFPRLLATIPSYVPIDYWGYGINLFSAMATGFFCTTIFYLNRKLNLNIYLNIFISFIWVLMPLTGYEAINVYANSYLQLTLLLILIYTLLPEIVEKNLLLFGVILILGTLSDPTVGVILIPLMYNLVNKKISIKNFLVGIFVVIFGILIQVFSLTISNVTRNPLPSISKLRPYLDGLFSSFLTNFPGMAYHPTDISNSYSVYPLTSKYLSILFLNFILMLIVVHILNKKIGLGLYLFSGLLTTLIPALSEGPNNRYFIVFNFILLHSICLSIDIVTKKKLISITLLCLPILANWSTAFFASDTRVYPYPEWSHWRTFIKEAKSECLINPDTKRNLIFSPNWPPPDYLREPSSSAIECKLLLDKS